MMLEEKLDALVHSKAVGEAIDELSARVLRDARLVEAGDHLANAVEEYIQTFVKFGGSKELDDAADRMTRSLQGYRERRAQRS